MPKYLLTKNLVQTHKDLVTYLVKYNFVTTPSIIDAFRSVNRKDFLPRDVTFPYVDEPISIGNGQTNSQPSTVAFMLELLQVMPGDIVLDIGSGSGWTTAILAHLVGKQGKVIGLERISELLYLGKKNLSKYNYSHAEIQEAKSDAIGLPGKKFNKILASAAASEFPTEILDQLSLKGRLVIPVRDSIWLYRKIDENKYLKSKYQGFAFVPLLK